jgi:hypothetical protein
MKSNERNKDYNISVFLKISHLKVMKNIDSICDKLNFKTYIAIVGAAGLFYDT